MSPAAAVDPTIRDYARRLGLLVSTSSDDDGDGDGGDSFLRLAAENMRRVASARVVATLRVPSGCQVGALASPDSNSQIQSKSVNWNVFL